MNTTKNDRLHALGQKQPVFFGGMSKMIDISTRSKRFIAEWQEMNVTSAYTAKAPARRNHIVAWRMVSVSLFSLPLWKNRKIPKQTKNAPTRIG